MKLNVIGIKRIKGDKSKAGNPYDICSLFAMVPIETAANDKLTITGQGYELAEMPLDPESMYLFDKVKFPQELNLTMDSRPRFGKFESVCVGFEVVTPKLSAAN